jgi:predicted RNA methylase
MKLTKPEIKLQKEVKEVLIKEVLTFEDKEFIYENFHPGTVADITSDSAYFTPLDMAYDFGLFAGRYGVCVDMCAGIGGLTFAARTRDHYDKKIKHSICIERNPKFIEIGKKLLPEAIWIQGDIFDKSIWDEITTTYGKVNYVYSNPPFGKVTKTGADRSWLKYKGADLDMAAIEVALNWCDNISMILPSGSLTFKYSGRPHYEEIENRKINKLKSDIGFDFIMSNPGIDTTAYDQFKGTKITVEYVDIERVVD